MSPGTLPSTQTIAPRGGAAGPAEGARRAAAPEPRYGRRPGAASPVRAPGVAELRAECVSPPGRRARARAVGHALRLEARTTRPLGQAIPRRFDQASAPATPFLPFCGTGPAAQGSGGRAAHESRCGSGCGRHSAVQRPDCLVNPKDTNPQRFSQPLGTPSCWTEGFESFGRRVDYSCPRASSLGSLWGYGRLSWGLPKYHHIILYLLVVSQESQQQLQARIKPNPSEVSAFMWLGPDVAAAVAATEDGTETPRHLPQELPPSVL